MTSINQPNRKIITKTELLKAITYLNNWGLAVGKSSSKCELLWLQQKNLLLISESGSRLTQIHSRFLNNKLMINDSCGAWIMDANDFLWLPLDLRNDSSTWKCHGIWLSSLIWHQRDLLWQIRRWNWVWINICNTLQFWMGRVDFDACGRWTSLMAEIAIFLTECAFTNLPILNAFNLHSCWNFGRMIRISWVNFWSGTYTCWGSALELFTQLVCGYSIKSIPNLLRLGLPLMLLIYEVYKGMCR